MDIFKLIQEFLSKEKEEPPVTDSNETDQTVDPPVDDPAPGDDPNETDSNETDQTVDPPEEGGETAPTPEEVAAERDSLAERLHAELVRADGRLADPADLPFNDEHLTDPEALAAAIAALVASKPGLKARRVAGDVGAGARGTATPTRAGLINVIRGMK